MFSMHRHLRKCFAFRLLQRGSHSEVASMAAVSRAASDDKGQTTKVDVTSMEEVKSASTMSTGRRKGMVAAAFASLKDESSKDKSVASLLVDERILKANTVNELLSIGTNKENKINRKQALTIISILSQWSSIGKVKPSEYESDERFTGICRILGRVVNRSNTNLGSDRHAAHRAADLNVVLHVTGEDEASKLVANLSLTQMVKVLTSLAQQKNRSLTLLRTVASNITANSEKMNMKVASDALYAMAILNFWDTVLIERICADAQAALPTTTKSAVVGSIVTSLGCLRYRNTEFLESVAEWTLKNFEECRTQDVAALFHSLGMLNYPTSKFDELKKKALREDEFPKSMDYLTHVWSLVLLNAATNEQVDSVLRREFIEKLVNERRGDLLPSTKKKLLNINAYATASKDYKGSFLPPESTIFAVPLMYSKEKQISVHGMLESLRSLVSLEKFVKISMNTNMGFVIDAECCFDAKGNPVPIEKADSSCKRVAFMVQEFNEMCQGTEICPSGITNLSTTLLEKTGRHVVSLPYNEFSVSEKLLKRVQYIDEKLKVILNKK
ncbi:FAST kinase domain-containing protein 4 [Culicoides brevitarsis]|uniref:FAST kinase domain-containing protein 4 n=1 Tax=Culicoides brevitarsis TaxID=469753 RepID=UPI00307CAB81